jgi:hypothetical protein
LGVNRVRYSKGWVSEVTGGGDTALELVETKTKTGTGTGTGTDGAVQSQVRTRSRTNSL